MSHSRASTQNEDTAGSRTDAPPGAPDQAAWAAFAEASTVESFCGAWLALQCARLSAVQVAVVLVEHGDGSYVPAAVWPDLRVDVSRLAGPAERALTEWSVGVNRQRIEQRFAGIGTAPVLH